MTKTCAGIVLLLLSLVFASQSHARMSGVDSDGGKGHRMQSIDEVDRGNCCDEARWWVTTPRPETASSIRSSDLAGHSCLELQDVQGRTALHHAALQGSSKLVRLLLAAGANADAKDNGGHTALDLAKSRGFWKIAAVLLDAGASVEGTGGSCGILMQRMTAERRSGVTRAIVASRDLSSG